MRSAGGATATSAVGDSAVGLRLARVGPLPPAAGAPSTLDLLGGAGAQFHELLDQALEHVRADAHGHPPPPLQLDHGGARAALLPVSGMASPVCLVPERSPPARRRPRTGRAAGIRAAAASAPSSRRRWRSACSRLRGGLRAVAAGGELGEAPAGPGRQRWGTNLCVLRVPPGAPRPQRRAALAVSLAPAPERSVARSSHPRGVQWAHLLRRLHLHGRGEPSG
eukprot:CAMPEP_0170401904 /NCGR_PEP_ID=MMETSP0117_2-20130122/25271_1 /TAXON_ID=400756 /ORGANISM="Durinskia baltica, Strain CSIRO CS-38" /LENGTH=222 /DNA_ID=CAMNT_0010658733 /DNA_START=47 /DNA_END=712 /DNA_ORIENTATION=+